MVSTGNNESDTLTFVSRILSTLQVDGANMIAIPILGACLGYAAYHNAEDVHRIHGCIHSTICANTEIGSVRCLSKVVDGTSLQAVTREELRYLSRQWCHLGGIESSEKQHGQWKKIMTHLLLSNDVVEPLPEWSKHLNNADFYFASVWSYMPLLCWDLTSLAGILFSTITKRDRDLGLDIAATLVCARLVQVLSFPSNFQSDVQNGSKIDEPNLSQADISMIESLKTFHIKSGDIFQCMIPFVQTIASLLRMVCGVDDLPPSQQVWNVMKYLKASPSLFDLVLITKWRQQLSTLQEGLVLERDAKFVKVIENTKESVIDGSVELAKPSSNDDMSMGSNHGNELFSQSIGFLSTPIHDLSYLGLRFTSDDNCLIKLPDSFVTLYSTIYNMQLLSNTDLDENESGGDDSDEEYSSSSGREIAICMITGEVILAGSSSRGMYYHSNNSPGRCTIHSKKNGAGVGIFFLLQKCLVLLLHNDKSAYSPSLYVDEHGEEDVGLRRGRPLYLHQERYQRLQKLWLQHEIPGDVARIRSTSDRVIRDNWY